MVEIMKEVTFITLMGCFSVILIAMTIITIYKSIEAVRGK